MRSCDLHPYRGSFLISIDFNEFRFDTGYSLDDIVSKPMESLITVQTDIDKLCRDRNPNRYNKPKDQENFAWWSNYTPLVRGPIESLQCDGVEGYQIEEVEIWNREKVRGSQVTGTFWR